MAGRFVVFMYLDDAALPASPVCGLAVGVMDDDFFYI
jgi:hypothetical protein